ncbi:MAG: hypothetical protein KF893_11215 [Caldilineaceae bacterium]|nr:hypothetical protein [Caldilineaceae bacterium]
MNRVPSLLPVNPDKSAHRSLVKITLILLLYGLLALIATFPLVHEFSTTVLGGGDTAQNLWNLWWGDLAIRRGEWLPYETTMIYHPDGVNLAFHTLSPINLWMGTVLHSGLGLSLTKSYNTLTLLTFVISAIGMHWLVYHLTGSHGAAMVAAMIFVFSPIRMSRLWFGNLNLYSTQAIPFALLFAVRSFQTGRSRDALLCGVMVAITAGLDLFLASGTILLIGLLWLMRWFSFVFQTRQLWSPLLRTATIAAISAAILGMPFALPLLLNADDFPGQGNQLAASRANNADLVGFFVPDNLTSPLVKRVTPALAMQIEQIYAQFYGNSAEKSVFLGYTVIGLLLITLTMRPSAQMRSWLISAGLFFVLALGPTLYVNGQAILSHLPYEWLSYLPLLGVNRSPSRFSLFGMLALAVTVGYGVAALERRRSWRGWGSLALALLVFVEFCTVPIRVDPRLGKIPAFYAQLGADPKERQGVILDVPVDMIGAQGPAAEYMLFQTVHERPIVSGYIARIPERVSAQMQDPFFHTLRARIYGDTDPFVLDDAFLVQAPSELQRLNIEYVILHRWVLTPVDIDTLFAAFTTLLDVPLYEDEQIVVWRTHSTAE